MSRERIALFMPGLAGGGAERIMLTLAEGLADRGYDVDLVVTNAKGPLADAIPESVRLVNLGAARIITSLPSLVRYLRRERPVAMLSAMAPANCVALWARALARISMRLVVAEHNTLSAAAGGARTQRDRLLPALMRRAYLKADAVVAVSAGVADDLSRVIGLPRERIEVVYNPVVTSRLLELSQENADHPWFAGGEPPVILGVGRFTAQKDFSTLVRAFAKLREKQNCRLMILGEGEERGALEALVVELGIEDSVALPGFVNNPYAYMRNAAIFVLSSQWEGLPTVLIEAMACETLVVSTDCPSGPSEILGDGRWGRLVPVGDMSSLEKGMEDMLAAETCEEVESRQRAETFSADNIVSQYLNTLVVQN